MATIALRIAGTALGTFIGGPLGGAIGSAVGGTVGYLVDQSLFGGAKRLTEGPRLTDLNGISASEGAPIPRAYGRVRLGGQVIWATEFEEERIIEKTGASGGKSLGGQSTRSVRYAYFANVAIGLCEGPIHFIRRIWADGEELDLAALSFRTYLGSQTQEPDPLIVAKQETSALPGFRGLAYLVFERFPLANYGNRLPQFSFEVIRAAPGLPDQLRAINIIPGSTEFGYSNVEVREDFGLGSSQPVNRAQWTHSTDWQASIEALTALAPHLERATLISAWFGDDLRVEQCTLRPRTEKAIKNTTGAQWTVAGLTRTSAVANSSNEGRPNFGGTPSDQSIIDAIRDLKARGLKVALHPFVLMDIPAGNARQDPYSGAASQPPFPWRGRITCDPAPGRAGSPEGTPALTGQIAAFVGSANAGHFSLVGGIVTYSGPDEWSFRRMVLHHAMLATAAGGVDTFIIGSELVGLTHAGAGGGAFPFVSAMIAMLADLRTILGPTTRITYAADWTEYGARVRSGGQEVAFPLDPLWAHAEIGAIAIDAYFPLSDWRNGRAHPDAAIATDAADPDYLKGRIFAGEGYEWFYADADARAAQARTPIADGAYAKPWVFRPKDLRNWWSNNHVERVNGVELGAPTAFVPQAKPILLAEIGCPAVDKGGNQPNVFPDPKSIENALPYFSSGARDDLVQRRVLESYLERLDPAAPGFDSADNPISSRYPGRMIEPGSIAPWAWDARPFPVFPRQRSLWADGANWLHGHWLNGRLEALPIDRLLGMIFADFGLARPLTRAISASIDGYVIDRPMSARAAIEPIATLFGLTARSQNADILFVGRPRAIDAELSDDALVPARDGARVTITRRQETELPRRLSLGFTDGENDFRSAVVAAETASLQSTREASETTAIAMPRGGARRLAETRLQDIWGARETIQFRMVPSARMFEPGDVVSLPTVSGRRSVMITKITDAGSRECEGRGYDPDFAEAAPTIDELPAETGTPALPGAAHVRFVELPIDNGGGLLSAAVRADPWRGPYSVLAIRDGVATTIAAVPGAARLGTTLTALPPGPLWRWDNAAVLDLVLEGGALASLGDEAVVAGGNALALTDSAGETEIVLFRRAELIGEKRYRVSGLLRGQGMSEASAARLLAAGADALVIDETTTGLGIGTDAIGAARRYTVLPAGRDLGDSTAVSRDVTVTGRALRPLAPVRAKARREAGGVRFSFIRRTRRDGDSLDLFEVPIGEGREEYLFEVLSGASTVRSATLTSPDYLYPAAQEAADFGGAQTFIAVRIRQASLEVGLGDPLVAMLAIA